MSLNVLNKKKDELGGTLVSSTNKIDWHDITY
jgi:hypothetical protein